MSQLKPRCRLYLQAAAPFSAKQESLLSQALSTFSPACVLIRMGTEPPDTAVLDKLIDHIQGAGAACLIEESIEASADLGADGVHILADEKLYQTARKVLGESANIGVACGLNRHEAMELAESGADYVAFGAPGQSDREVEFERLAETVAWWSEIFVVPCVAWNIADRAEAVALTKLGVDFIAPPSTIWDSDGALEALGEIDQAIGSIRREA
ncbi:MAG: thiamine phosphate synthase [Pseudomonadota bacterium]